MNQERERILQQLQELIDKGGDSDAIYRVMREALGVRPVPHELLRTLLRRQVEAGRAAVSPEELAKREERVRQHWDEITHPSPRATDPQHPVGAAASVRLYLESWATARSGQAIDLAKPPFPLFATAATP